MSLLFQCTFQPELLKLFNRAVIAMARIHEEITLEFRRQKVNLRSINASQSVFAFFELRPAFFSSYEFNAETTLRYKLAAKSLLITLKTLSSCTGYSLMGFRTPQGEDHSLFVRTEHGPEVEKEFRFYTQLTEPLAAVYDKEKMPNVLTLESKLFNQFLGNFPSQLDEVAFLVRQHGDDLQFQSYVDSGDTDARNKLRTDVCVRKSDFEGFLLRNPSDMALVLPFKEARAFTLFAESCAIRADIYFEDSGKPVVFSCGEKERESFYVMDVVLATLANVNAASAEPAASNSNTTSERHPVARQPLAPPPQQQQQPQQPPVATMADSIANSMEVSSRVGHRAMPSISSSLEESSQLQRMRMQPPQNTTNKAAHARPPKSKSPTMSLLMDQSSILSRSHDDDTSTISIPAGNHHHDDDDDDPGAAFLEADSEPVPTPEVGRFTQGVLSAVAVESQRRVMVPAPTSKRPLAQIAAALPPAKRHFAPPNGEPDDDEEDEEEYVDATPPMSKRAR